MLSTGISIEHELRPCYVAIKKGKKEKGLFHGWNLLAMLLNHLRIARELWS